MLRVTLSLLAAMAALRAESALDSARALVQQHKYVEARAVLERILATEPANAAACHELGLVLRKRSDTPAYEEAVKWLARAAELEPMNPEYLADFGGTSLQLASRTNSPSAATKGRDAMERAVRLKPDYIEAHEGLFQFYQRAPWPLGSGAKAAAHLEAIRRLDPERATILGVTAKINAKEFAAAFELCEAVLAKHPHDYVALYNYGRTAAFAGTNLPAGLARLNECLTLEPPSPASPGHSYVWLRIGSIQQQLNHPEQARAAFATAVKLDPGNKLAADALAKSK